MDPTLSPNEAANDLAGRQARSYQRNRWRSNRNSIRLRHTCDHTSPAVSRAWETVCHTSFQSLIGRYQKGTELSRVLYMAFAIFMAVCGLAFHVRNDQEIVLNYIAGSLQIELSIVVVGALVAGAILGVLAMTATVLRLRRNIRRLSRRNEIASRELSSLRAISLNDGG